MRKSKPKEVSNTISCKNVNGDITINVTLNTI